MSQPPRDDGRRYLFDNPRNVRLMIRALVAACAAVFIADFFIERHGYHDWEDMIGFYAVFGFAAYALLVLLAEGLRFLVQKGENFYND
ncbi:MAG: hypothetical protein GDA49_06120 [Rhodospirillales bacterium]|nr:hypothetical protein [Rhodospirillales bacterium]